jgi:Sap, sulfolipid-1-addressing protein
VISTLVYLVMEIYAGFRPERAQSMLTGIRSWIESHTDQVIIILSLALGLWLVGKSIYVLVT